MTGSHIQPWALAAIARESLAYGNEHRDAPVTEQALWRLHDLFMNLEDPFIRSGGDGPWDLLVRGAYEQLDWQGGIHFPLARFAAIFDRDFGPGYEVLSRTALTDLLGADPGVYASANMVFTVGAMRNGGLFDLAWLDQPQCADVVERVPAAVLREVFARSYGASYALVAARAGADRHVDPAQRRLDPNPLAATPYVQMPQLSATTYLAPAPRLVADRASVNAVYYLGQQQWNTKFTRDLGKLIEAYAGEQLTQVPHAALIPARTYGRGGGAATVDWVLVLPGLVLLVEVKSARVASAGRRDLAGWTEDVRRDVGKAMTQIATMANLLRQEHPVFADVPTDRPVRALVVTAEPHHLINSPIYRRHLPDPGVPTTVMSLQALEEAVAWALVREPSEVFLALTDYRDSPGHDSEQPAHLMDRWLREQALTHNPPNPLLDTAWERHAWHQEDQADPQQAS